MCKRPSTNNIFPPCPPLHPFFNVGVSFFKCQSTWQHWREGGTGGTESRGILGVEAWSCSLRFYFRSTVKHITHEPLQEWILRCKVFYLTSQEHAWWEQGQVLELRFHFPSRACFLTHWVCLGMECRVKLAVSLQRKKASASENDEAKRIRKQCVCMPNVACTRPARGPVEARSRPSRGPVRGPVEKLE